MIALNTRLYNIRSRSYAIYIVIALLIVSLVDLSSFPELAAVGAYALLIFGIELAVVYLFYKRFHTPDADHAEPTDKA